MISTRRGFIRGLGAMLAAPAIVRAASLMPIKVAPVVEPAYWGIVHPQNVGDLIDFDAVLRQMGRGLGIPDAKMRAGQFNDMRLRA